MFIMASGSHPFNGTATPDTKLYKCLVSKRDDLFWNHHQKLLPNCEVFKNADFQNLFASMVTMRPNERPTIEEIAQHPWLQGETLTQEEIIAEFQHRYEKLQQELEAQ